MQFENFNRVREMIRDGAIGELQEVSAWGNRQLRRSGYLPAARRSAQVPALRFVARAVAVSSLQSGIFFRRSGMNCLQWNMYWDFGSGQVGDMGSHTMDLAWNAIDAGLPTSAEGKGDPFNPEVTPVKLETHFEIPANDWRRAIRFRGIKAAPCRNRPIARIDLNKIDHGAMFEGSKGFIVADFQSRILFPQGERVPT